MKHCNKCKIEKSLEEFPKRSRTKDGLHTQCKECQSSYHRAHYAANIDRITENHRLYRVNNPEYQSDYYAKNRERFSEYMRDQYVQKRDQKLAAVKAYYVANPEKIAASRFARRARDLGAEGSHTASDIKSIFESQRGMCASCKKKLAITGKNKYHVDHINPLSKGGSNSKENLQCLCPSCNHRKHAKDPFDWAKENGKLL
jgi:5-methylcytosine-specific restriction endonuclease McrA